MIQRNLVINDGRIVDFTTDTPQCDRRINAAGLVAIPGLIDTHVHYGVYSPIDEAARCIPNRPFITFWLTFSMLPLFWKMKFVKEATIPSRSLPTTVMPIRIFFTRICCGLTLINFKPIVWIIALLDDFALLLAFIL